MARAERISTGQGVLFPELFPEREVPKDEPGVSVSLYAHTTGLYVALCQLGRMSRNSAALYKEVPIPEIEGSPRFQENIQHNIRERERDAYESFTAAFAGSAAVAAAVEYDPAAETRKGWIEFVNKYGGPAGRNSRDKYRNRLARNIKRAGWPVPQVR